MDTTPSMVTDLENLLVQEFRFCQMLLNLTKDERLALIKNDTQTLSVLTERKEVLLDELSQIDDRRRMIAMELSCAIGLQATSPNIAAIAAELNPETGARINRLRDGILALAADIRDLTSGNRTLALSALERTDTLQAFLLDHLKPTLFYQIPGAHPQVEAETIWGIEQHL